MNQKKEKYTPTGANYLGLSFQMGILIFLGAYGGLKLDQFIGWRTPVFAIVFSLLAIAFSMYYIILKGTDKKKKNE